MDPFRVLNAQLVPTQGLGATDAGNSAQTWTVDSAADQHWSAVELRSGHGDPLGPTDRGPRNYKRPDTLILDDVAEVLARDPLINSFDLEIDCKDGVVRIAGNVPLQPVRQRLEVLVASIFGVRDFDISNIVVSKGISARVDD